MNREIIVAGNKDYGLAKAIYKKYPHATFCSRSNGGYNFYMKESITRFARKTLDYDVCIFCTNVRKYFQIFLASTVWELWTEYIDSGGDRYDIGTHFIVIGSTADSSPGTNSNALEKKALKEWCRRYGEKAPEYGIRITYVAPGILDVESMKRKYGEESDKLDPAYVVDVIDWILHQPDNVNIYEISMDPLLYNYR